MEATSHYSRMSAYSRGHRPLHHLVLALLITSTIGTANALETDFRGYLGYVGVSSDEDVECESRACQGILDSSLFYGLSLGVQGEELGAQLVVSQDDEAEPELSIAQLTARTGFGGIQASARVGKIIVPLGLYGSQRITPTARPGLVLPQSFLLNTYYDLLTLSEQGLALQINSEAWTFKAAAYKPRKEVVERIIELPTNAQANFFQGLISLLFNDVESSSSGNTVTIVERQEFDGGYLGVSHQGAVAKSDLGFVRLDLDGSRLDALNLGTAWNLGAWEPSIELFQLDFVDVGNKLQGGSMNLTYSAESWQGFGNAVLIDAEGTTSREYTAGGAYYWDDHWSGLLALHRLEGDFSNVSSTNANEVHTLSLSLAYSWH